MNRFLKKLWDDPLIRQGGAVFLSTLLFNVFNLVYWLIMVRRLSAENYGVLNSLFSLMMFLSLPVGILQTVMTRYVSKLVAKDQKKEVRSLLLYFLKAIFLFCAFLLLVLMLLSGPIARFLQIQERGLIFLVLGGVFFSSLSTLFLGTLYGMQKFYAIALNNSVNGFVKLAAGFILVALGLKVYGALGGVVAAFFAAFLLAFLQLPCWVKKGFLGARDRILEIKEIYRYFWPVGLSNLCFLAMTNMDIVLVKHYFAPLEAGFYSVAQMVGKIVLFFPAAIGLVMFPKVVDGHAKSQNTLAILKSSLVIVAGLCGAATVFSVLFPAFVLSALTGHTQSLAVSMVKFFAVSMSLLAMIQIFMYYHLSLHRMRFIYLMAVVALLEFFGILLFHSSMTQVLWIVLTCSAFLFAGGLLFTFSRNSKRAP
ncbi:MAG: oligosaccharide flippase family protein [Candidatus Omnitrophota bacterium]